MDTYEALQDYLKKAGIDPAATLLYIELSTAGPGSALQLAKKTAVSRTQVYRHLEALQASGLVSAEQLSYGTLFRALPLDNLEGLIADREAQTANLRHDLGAMTTLLQHLAGSHGPQASVTHLYGLAGLKQANWNLTKADGECRIFDAAQSSDHLDKAFARHFRERVIEKNLQTFNLTNATNITAARLEPFAPSRTHYRHIDPSVLAISFEVYIYNDVVALLDYNKDNMQATEIHHPALHTMMRQLFDAMWNLGEPITIQ